MGNEKNIQYLVMRTVGGRERTSCGVGIRSSRDRSIRMLGIPNAEYDDAAGERHEAGLGCGIVPACFADRPEVSLYEGMIELKITRDTFQPSNMQ